MDEDQRRRSSQPADHRTKVDQPEFKRQPAANIEKTSINSTTSAESLSNISKSHTKRQPIAGRHASVPGPSSNVATASRQNAATTSEHVIECDRNSKIVEESELSPALNDNRKGELERLTSDDINKLDDRHNDDVIPAWPSRQEAMAMGASSDVISHQVYSLRDYSQVANPSLAIQKINPSDHPRASKKISAPAPNYTAKLLKSMSQDRKIGSQSKRMSECAYTSSKGFDHVAKIGPFNGPDETQGELVSSSRLSVGASESSSRNVAANNLLGESRIDRMRKLFVGPLSLRSTAKVGLHAQHQQNPRLSLQSGTSVLNKPHHLMHAMYRSGIGVGYGRRSALRDKQAKSFRVYGCPLQMANNIYPITCFGRADVYKQQSVPYILARLCSYIEENSSQLTHEGIFRVSGNARLMEKLRTLFDHLGDAPLESESVDVATSASMLKMYLRELPEPLIPTRMNYYFIHLAKKYLNKDNAGSRYSSNDMQAMSLEKISENQRGAFSRDLTKLVKKLPAENYNLLKYLACFLHRISLKQEYNKMCAEALGIVFGPNVFRIRSESYKGLKEQELSNQIMANIISNYKSIFDSELTDPLGNLIRNEENTDCRLSPGCSGKLALTSRQAQELSELPAKLCASPRSIVSSPIPSTSRDQEATFVDTKGLSGEGFLEGDHYGHEPDLLDTESFSDEEHTHNEETDLDIGESYTPSSASVSYCSSMDSDSMESTYGHQSENDLEDSGSSIECISNTSYTPTSSHSTSDEHSAGRSLSAETSSADSDGADASIEGPDACTKVARTSGILDRECSRCRRESLIRDSKSKESPIGHSVTNDFREEHTAETLPKPVDLDTEFGLSKHSGLQDDDSRKSSRQSEKEKLDEIQAEPMTRCKKANSTNQGRTRHHSAKHSSHALKRRSSSASSLGRIRLRRDHMAATYRRVSRDSENYHRSAKGFSGDKRKTNDSTRSAHYSSRRSRGKSHGSRKIGCSQRHDELSPMKRSSKSQRRTIGARRRTSPSTCEANELESYLDFTAQLMNDADFDWNLWHAQYLEHLENSGGKVYQLRTSNSDDMLYRTTNYTFNETNSRRRFSGQAVHERESNIEQFFHPCDQISEDALIPNEKLEPGTQIVDPHIASSFISLLDSIVSSFVIKSELSVFPCAEDQCIDDAIVTQLVATRRLITALKRLLKFATSRGYSKKLRSIVLDIALKENPSISRSVIHCYPLVDHMAATSLATLIEEEIERCGEDYQGLQECLDEIIEAELRNFRQRYKNLKNIYDHCRKNHRIDSHSRHGRVGAQVIINPAHKSLDTLRKSESSTIYGKSLPRNLAGIHAKSKYLHEKQNVSGAISMRRRLMDEPHRLRASSLGTRASSSQSSRCTQGAVSSLLKEEEADLRGSEEPLSSETDSGCKFGAICPIEFVYNIEKLLVSKRLAGSRMVELHGMSLEQLQAEKLELQKNLLRYEHWFGRPATKFDHSIVGHLYERYRAVKYLKRLKSMTQTGELDRSP